MVNGWRRAFCTSIPKHKEPKVVTEKQQHHCDNTNQNPKISSKFAFFSNPSTPRSQSQPVSSPSLRCRTSVAAGNLNCYVPNSPKLQCTNAKTPKKQNSPGLFQLSNPSSPKSPSSFSILKASLRLCKSRCGICMQVVKTGQGTAIFTAECSHTFHFPCIATHVKKQQNLICPVCNTIWRELPVLAIHNDRANSNPGRDMKIRSLKVYNDDEPLMSPASITRFSPIPESDENEEDSEEEPMEFQGFFVNPVVTSTLSSPRIKTHVRNVEVSLLPEAAILAAGRSYETHVVVLKVKAPPSPSVTGSAKKLSKMAASRAPIDIVTVVDVGGTMAGVKLQMIKRLMKVVVSSLGSTDRLSIVAFSWGSKRLLPLRRMTSSGQRAAHRIVDALVTIDQAREAASVKNDALKKAAKVLEDRREKNAVTSIIVLSDGHDERLTIPLYNNQICPLVVSSTLFFPLDVPVYSVAIPDGGACGHALPDNAFAKCINNLLTMVAQDMKLQLGVLSRSLPAEIAAIYSTSGHPDVFGSGQFSVGGLYAEEERELLVELKVPAASAGSHHVLSVQSSYRDPSTQDLVYSKKQALFIPRPHTIRSSDPKIERLRNLHITIRAVIESRRLAEHGDLSGAHHLLSLARALLIHSSQKSADEYMRRLEVEQAELQRRKLSHKARACSRVEEKLEPLTPTSAWRAAERLAKVAIMRKSMNRVSDLHGFENAGF